MKALCITVANREIILNVAFMMKGEGNPFILWFFEAEANLSNT
jgi:hypothetical protein